ncbi:MAG: hypothetical protein ACE15E_03080 [Acidobacteriota bacterium]
MLKRLLRYLEQTFQLQQRCWLQLRDRRRQPRIPTCVAVKAVWLGMIARMGSLNALEETIGPHCTRLLGQALCSADTISLIYYQQDNEFLRAAIRHVYVTLKRNKALPLNHGQAVAIIDGHESHASFEYHCEDWRTERYRHRSRVWSKSNGGLVMSKTADFRAALACRPGTRVPLWELEFHAWDAASGRHMVLGREFERLSGAQKETALCRNAEIILSVCAEMGFAAVTGPGAYWEQVPGDLAYYVLPGDYPERQMAVLRKMAGGLGLTRGQHRRRDSRLLRPGLLRKALSRA